MAKRKNIDWSQYLAEQKQSGKSVVDFCKEKNIHPTTFYSARKRHKPSRFVEISVSKGQGNGPAIIVQRNGYTLSVEPGFCEATLKKILSILG